MKKLIIAEKPSVARDLAKALGKVSKKDDYFENEEWIIDSAIGHLVELYMPDDFDKKLKAWKIANLPIIPPKFELKAVSTAKKKFQSLKKQLKRKDVDFVINACDAGREGELIFNYIYELSGSKLSVKRLWLLSMTEKSIREAFNNLRGPAKCNPCWMRRGAGLNLIGSLESTVPGRSQSKETKPVAGRYQLLAGFKPPPSPSLLSASTKFKISNLRLIIPFGLILKLPMVSIRGFFKKKTSRKTSKTIATGLIGSGMKATHNRSSNRCNKPVSALYLKQRKEQSRALPDFMI